MQSRGYLMEHTIEIATDVLVELLWLNDDDGMQTALLEETKLEVLHGLRGAGEEYAISRDSDFAVIHCGG